MATGNFVFFLLMALVAVNLIFAESEPEPPPSGENQDAHPHDGPDEEPNQRFFFHGYFTSCNYTATAGASCSSCTTALRCFPNNVGLARNCRGFLPFCNNGRCSFFAPSNCTASG